MHRLCTNGKRPLDLKNMSGFELLSAMVEVILLVPSITETIPMKMDIIKKCIVNFTVKADFRHLNPVG
jgi:hypothetical protein